MVLELSRNWISFHTDALINARAMPSWEAVDYLTQNLFGDSPNTKLLEAKAPYEEITQFLQRIYGPIVEAATRQVGTPASSRVQVFTDISLMSDSTVLIVSVSDEAKEPQLLMMDAIRAWDVVFPNADSFNEWAESRYQQVLTALAAGKAAVLAAAGLGGCNGKAAVPRAKSLSWQAWDGLGEMSSGRAGAIHEAAIEACYTDDLT